MLTSILEVRNVRLTEEMLGILWWNLAGAASETPPTGPRPLPLLPSAVGQ